MKAKGCTIARPDIALRQIVKMLKKMYSQTKK